MSAGGGESLAVRVLVRLRPVNEREQHEMGASADEFAYRIADGHGSTSTTGSATAPVSIALTGSRYVASFI